MAIISLRAYNHEIEGMIDNGQLDEAVAHCRHILATFPKHIASYRLLGKAHLEQQRISDATDIFQRVLTAIPDDFIANVGMSIIREDENNLDAAIWHMDLAYEAQPANLAIQDELRRLYGRRDGTQPPKVRLTRGALARMYAKGGLYDQAIAELRAAIVEDPNRPDLQLLLAQMFYQTSQRVEAVDTCVSILKKIPLCLEANRILAITLPVAEGSDAVKNYRQIVISMDPYYAFAEPNAISSDQVPEGAVNIERLEWRSGLQIAETPDQPTWATSLGISMETPADEKIPDWLKSAEAPAPRSTDEKVAPGVSPFIWDTQEVEKIITDTSKPESDIPDWMKDAGWKPATGEATQAPQVPKPEQPAADAVDADVMANEDVEKGNIPEWLRGIAPEGVLGQEKNEIQPAEEELSNPWLEPKQPGPTDSIIEWLDEKKPTAPDNRPAQEENIAMSPEEEMPDWLKGLDVPQAAPASDEMPAEPTSAFTFEPSAFIEEPAVPESAAAEENPLGEVVEPAKAERTADTELIFPSEEAASKEPPAELAEEIPDWLKELAEEAPGAAAFASTGDESSADIPQISEVEPTTEQSLPAEAAQAEEVATAAKEITGEELAEAAEALPETELPAIVEDLPAAEEPSISEEVATLATPETAQAVPEAELPMITEEQPPAEEKPISEEATLTELPVTTQAVPEGELPMITEEQPLAEEKTISEEAAPTELPVTAEAFVEGEMPAIAEALPAVEDMSTTEEISAVELPMTEKELPAAELPLISEEELQIEQPIPAEGELAPSELDSMAEPEDLSWLEGLVAEQGAKEQLITPLPDGEVSPPEWVKLETEPAMEEPVEMEPRAVGETSAVPAEEIPEWIKGLGEELEIEQPPEAAPSAVPPEAEIPQSEELPTWLLEMEQPEAEKETPITAEEALDWKSEELPDWLKEITESEESKPASAGQEGLPAIEFPTGLVEAIPEQAEDKVLPPAPIEEVLREALPETEPWLPEVEEPAKPVSAIPVEEEAETIPVMEELTTKAVDITPAAEPEPNVQPVEIASEADVAALLDARNAIDQGQTAQALGFYSGLIKQNSHLGEIIKDLQDALYRFPVDVDMWVALGDAHYRTDDLQEALNAYIKAEELVR